MGCVLLTSLRVLCQKLQYCSNRLPLCWKGQWEASTGGICSYRQRWRFCWPSHLLSYGCRIKPRPPLLIWSSGLWYATTWSSMVGRQGLQICVGCWATHSWLSNLRLLVGHYWQHDRALRRRWPCQQPDTNQQLSNWTWVSCRVGSGTTSSFPYLIFNHYLKKMSIIWYRRLIS